MPPSIAVAGLSDVGQVRRRNEDSFTVIPDMGIAVVADGMGGHPGGDVASKVAAEATATRLAEAVTGHRNGSKRLGEGPSPSTSDHDVFVERFRPVMTEAVLAAHRAIRDEAAAQPSLDGMGTTLTAMVMSPESGAWVIGHVGDSRAYLFRQGTLSQLTRDDTWIQDQIEHGVMQPESAKLSPYAHLLTQCVGLEDAPTPHVLNGLAQEGDVYLLCTDGLVGMVDDARVTEILGEKAPLERLVAEANEAGGQDNITAALVRFG